jgi:Kelch motif protein/galactose oxidase-like protein
MNPRHIDVLLASLALVGCGGPGARLEIELRSPMDPTLLDAVDTFVFSVENPQGPLEVRQLDRRAGHLVVDKIPYGPALTFRLEGLVRKTPRVVGQSCPTDVLANRPLPPLSLLVTRAGAFAPVDDPGKAWMRPLALVRSDDLVVLAGAAGEGAARFDPRTGTWTDERPLVRPRLQADIAALGGGDFLVVGGQDENGAPVGELETYRSGDGFVVDRGVDSGFGGVGTRATGLADGRVLVTGGGLPRQRARSDVALFERGELMRVGAMLTGRRCHTVSAVSGGLGAAFAIGGDGGEGQPELAEIEIINPSPPPGAPFALTVGHLAIPRAEHTATVLVATGEILVVGGRNGGVPLASVEIFDQTTRYQTDGGKLSLTHARQQHVATVLRDGRVLITGGLGEDGKPITAAEIYEPRNRVIAAARPMNVARANHVAVLLCDGTVLLAGGGAGAEIYNPAP